MKEAVMRLGRWRIQRTLGRDLAGTYYAAIGDGGERATLYRPAGELAPPRSDALARLIDLHRGLADRGVVGLRAIERDGEHPLVVGDPVPDAMLSLQRGQRPDPGQTCALGTGLADALAALHDRGAVHGGLDLDTALWAPGEPPRLLGAGATLIAGGELAQPAGDVAGLGRLLCALVASWRRPAGGEARSADELRTIERIRTIADPGAGLSLARARALLADEVRDGDADAMAATVEPTGAVTRIGRYRILGRLGAGGMGEVFVGHDPALRRGVAIKRIRPALQRDPTFRARLRREAQLAAQLGHRAIVPVFDLIGEDDIDHLVMEYVPGPSLHALLAGQPMPVGEAVRIAIELADGLAHAHDHGIVHRDLKLENVLITTDGQPRIVDFGIARRSPRAGERRGEPVTRDGFMVGTSRAMSPEQIQCGDVDARSDLFSLGTLVYELVTGATPFAASAEALTMLRVIGDRQVPACDAIAGVPRALSELIDHLLEKSPAQRPDSARTVRDRLCRIRDAADAHAEPITAVMPALAVPPVAPSAGAPVVRSERREVAVACIDLVAVTGLAGPGGDELADRELLADALPGFRARIDEIVARSDGIVVSAHGPRIVACFGHARHTDRVARRAVLAGRAMLTAALELRSGDPLHLRARFAATGAIHAGLAVVRGGGGGAGSEELLLGATLDTALRLLHLGRVGDLWLSEVAARAVETEFQLERPATLPAGIPEARRFVAAVVASGSGEYGLPLPRDLELPPVIAVAPPRRSVEGTEPPPLRPSLLPPPRAASPSELGLAGAPIRRASGSRIQAPFVLAEIRALRASIFKRSPEIRSALAIADRVEHCYDLHRADLFIPAGDTWCAILEPFAMSVLTGVLRRIGLEIFPQYVSILGIPPPDVRTAMDLRQPTDLVRVICDAYSKCVVGTDAGALTPTIAGTRAIVADTTIIPCQLQMGVFLGAGQLTGLFRDTALTEKRCRSRGDAACTYEFAF